MAQPVVRPPCKPRFFADSFKAASGSFGNQSAFLLAKRAQPCCEIRLYGNDAAPRALSFRSLYLDMSTHKINLVPIETLDFGISYARERSDCKHRKHTRSHAACGF